MIKNRLRFLMSANFACGLIYSMFVEEFGLINGGLFSIPFLCLLAVAEWRLELEIEDEQ